MKNLLILATLLATVSSASAALNRQKPDNQSHACAAQALESSKALFTAFYGADVEQADGGATFSEEKEMPSIKSVSGKTTLTVLETTASIGKMGAYRIRMIYDVLDGSPTICAPAGQEILDIASF